MAAVSPSGPKAMQRTWPRAPDVLYCTVLCCAVLCCTVLYYATLADLAGVGGEAQQAEPEGAEALRVVGRPMAAAQGRGEDDRHRAKPVIMIVAIIIIIIIITISFFIQLFVYTGNTIPYCTILYYTII